MLPEKLEKTLNVIFSAELSCAAAAAAFGAAWLRPGYMGPEALAGLIFFFLFELLLFVNEMAFSMAASERSGMIFSGLRQLVFYLYGITALVLNATLGSLWPLILFLVRVLPLWLSPGVNFDALTDEEIEWRELRAVMYGVLPLLLWGETVFLGVVLRGASGGITREIAVLTSGKLCSIVDWFSPGSIPVLIISGALYYTLMFFGHLIVLGDDGLFVAWLRAKNRLKHIK